MMTYAQVEKDSKKIIDSINLTEREVSSFFGMFSKIKYHFFAYCLLGGLSYFSLPQPQNIGLWLFFVAFGVFHWLVIFSFTASYASLFNMIGSEKIKDLELAKIITKKLRAYGVVWFVLLVAFGLVGVVTEWSILPLVIGNFITTLLIFFVFNVDMSRYQIPAIIGVIKSIKS
jgi:hypothetical protein